MFTVLITETGEIYACRPDQTLLKAMERLGRKGIPIGCRGGGCGVCKVQIEDGEVACAAMSRAHISDAERKAGRVLACRSQPRSDIRLSVVGKMQKAVCRR